MRYFGFILLLTFLWSDSMAQHISLDGKSLSALKQISKYSDSKQLFSIPSLQYIPSTKSSSTPIANQTPTKHIPLAYAYKELAPFCKLEVKMEKVAKMPIKVRLGSVDYVDWLEGKRDWMLNAGF